MALPNLILSTDSFQTWFDATNNLISHGADSNNYLIANIPMTANATVDGYFTAKNLTVTQNSTFGTSSTDGAVFNATVQFNAPVTLTNDITIAGGSSDLTVGGKVDIGAGLIVDGTTLVVNSTSNRVGIGVAVPATALDVVGTVNATAFIGNGADISTINATNITSGTLSLPRLGVVQPGHLLVGNATSTAQAMPITGDVTFDSLGVTSIGVGKVTSAMILDGTIANTDISPTAQIAHSKLATLTGGRVLMGNSTNGVEGLSLTGDVTISSGGVTTIGSSKVTSAMIVDGTIANTDISDTANITKTKISGTAVTLADVGTVTSTMIADGTIVNADVSANAAIAVSKLAASSISGVTLGNNLNAATFNNSGSGAASGSTYNGSGALTVSYNTVGAPSTTGTNASGTWEINVSGTSGSISGFNNPTTAATSSTIVYRDGSGHITGNYIFGSFFIASAGNNANPSIGQIWTQDTSGDNYLRKSTPAHFVSALKLLTSDNFTSCAVSTQYNSSLNSDSRNSRGVTRLYRRDSDSDYSVQTYWTGARWRMYGYSGDSNHADTHVGYADAAGEATNGRLVYDNGLYSGGVGYREASNMYVSAARYVYNNGTYSGSGWVEPSDLGVRYASSAGSANSATTAGYATSAATARNITDYTINQNLATGSSVTFQAITSTSSLTCSGTYLSNSGPIISGPGGEYISYIAGLNVLAYGGSGYVGGYRHNFTGSVNIFGNQVIRGDLTLTTTLGVPGSTATITAGNISVSGSKNFEIIHPVLPDKKLRYTSIEAPRCDLIHRGTATFTGTAQINLDTYANLAAGTFVALMRDCQCVVTNDSSWTPVRGRVVDNMLLLESASSTESVTVSWIVIGERHDGEIKTSKMTDATGRLINEFDAPPSDS